MPLINHPVVQYAFVADDIDAAIMRWVETFGAGPFLKIPHWKGAENQLYRGKPSEDDVSHAHGQCGAVQIQITQQHDDSPSIWREVLPAGGAGFHHVAIIVSDFEAEKARLIAMGCPAAEEFRYDTGTGAEHVTLADGVVPPRYGHVAYMDARAKMGCFIELLEKNAIIDHEFEAVKALHQGWDGRDPIRFAV